MSHQTATINVLKTLCLLRDRGGRLGISDMMASIGVSRATAYRYLSYLESFGLVSRYGRGDFIFGPEIHLLEKAARTGDPIAAAAMPVLGALCSHTGATVLVEKVCGLSRTVVLIQPGRLGPVRLADLLGVAVSANGEEEGAKTVDHLTSLKVEIHTCADDSSERGGVPDEQDASGDDRDTFCVVEGERIEATVFACPVMLQGRLVSRVVALVQPGVAGLPDPTSIQEQVRRAALRMEGRLA